MTISELDIDGAYCFSDNVFKDNRGMFTEAWDSVQMAEIGLHFQPASAAFSFNQRSGTLRGLHYQAEPHGQAKVVTCVAGKIYDVILDLRKQSSSYLKWTAVEISAFTGKSVYIPKGCAHGFVTLEDETVVSYLIEGDYISAKSMAVRWDDPAFGIKWPAADLIISKKDSNAPNFSA